MPPPPDNYSNQAMVPGIGPRPPQGSGGGPGGPGPSGQCFNSAPVKSDGSFGFHFLRPGQYTLRLYTGDGSSYDVSGTFSVTAGVSTNIGTVTPVGL